MLEPLFHTAHELSVERMPYALAVVVRHQRPISGKAGDKAIILPDGRITGWIGGGCTNPLIVEEARKALKDGQHRLVRISPDAESGTDGIITHTMTCHSGGALDIYIEPVMPKPQLIVLGRTELARVLCRLALAIKYQVVVAAPGAEAAMFEGADHFQTHLDLSTVNLKGPTFVVVATQGEYDVEALKETLSRDATHIAFVASRRKAAEILRELSESGLDPEALSRIETPAGLDIGARLPEEIALSILAQIVALYRAEDPSNTVADAVSPTLETMIIEGMSCAHCILTVRQALESTPGVSVHDVRIGQAEVSLADGAACREDALRALELKGFTARLAPSA